MIFTKTNLKGNYLINLEPHSDSRGFFARYFCSKEFERKKLNTKWVQANTSMSRRKGTLRGLHYQRPPHAEVKLVRCLRGSIWDVVVDLRHESKTYGKWFGAILSEKNRAMMYVPKGFAHGFISLQSRVEILYLVSAFYAQKHEETLLWNDPDVKINWPLKPTIISRYDAFGQKLHQLKSIKVSNK
jgi:dTDP-4-dehydrorhamnose 3,5-epimerase